MLKVIGGEQEGEFKAVASGTLPNGKPVVVNADGTVSVVGETSGTESIGSPDVFNNALTSHTAAVYDTANDKVVIAYRDNGNSNYGTAIVGTVSGSSISFGTEVVFESSGASYVEAAYDVASGKVVIAYRDLSDSYGRAIVGTVSGTTISFGTKQVFSTTGSIEQISIVYAETQEKVVIAYRDSGTNGEAVVGTVSGTSISFGTVVEFYTGGSGDYAVVYNPTDSNVIIGFRADSTTSGEAIVGTISGTSISFGSQNRFSENNVNYIKGTYDVAAQRVVFVYSDGTDGSKGKAVVGSISGNTITFGTEVVFNNASTTYPDVNYHVAGQRVVVAYTDETSALNYGKFIVGTVSGTSISFGTPATYESASTDYSDLTYDSDTGQMVVAYRDLGGGNVGQTVVFQIDYTVSNLTAENYIGMSRGVVEEVDVSYGSVTTFASTNIYTTQAVYDANAQKVVVVYGDSTDNTAKAVVGTINASTNSITFGTAVQFNNSTTQDVAIGYDANAQKVVVAYRDVGLSYYGVARVGTVSGNSISFGTETTFYSSYFERCQISFDSSANKVVIVGADSATNYGYAVVGTVSGTSISFGSAVAFAGTNSVNGVMGLVYDASADKTAIAYTDYSDSSQGKVIVGTVSGTSISFGSPVVFETSGTSYPVMVYSPTDQKIVVAYRKASSGAFVVVGTISGSSVTFGSSNSVATTSGVYYIGLGYNTENNKYSIAYGDNGDSNQGKIFEGTLSGTVMSFDAGQTFETGATVFSYFAYDSTNNRQLLVFEDQTDSGNGKCLVVQNGATNRYPVADGNPASLDIIGSVSTNQSGLTAGEKYYVQTDGTLSTTAGSPSVLAGTAISATKLVVKT